MYYTCTHTLPRSLVEFDVCGCYWYSMSNIFQEYEEESKMDREKIISKISRHIK